MMKGLVSLGSFVRRQPVVVLLLLLLSGCAGNRYAQLGDFNQLPALGRDHAYVIVRDEFGGSPLPGMKVRILSKMGTMEFVSNERGMICVPVSSALIKENPRIAVESSAPVELYSPVVRVGYRRGNGSRFVLVSTEDMEKLASDGYFIWYTPKFRREAEEAQTILSRQREMIRSVFGMQPMLWGVVLLGDGVQKDAAYLVPEVDSGAVTWCCPVSDIADGHFQSVNIHEWTEMTVAVGLPIYPFDPRNRFVGDGLAEYMMFMEDGDLGGVEKPTYDVQAAGVHSINLLEEFTTAHEAHVSGTVEGAGYGLSFCFWYRLCQQYGDDFPKRFVARVRASRKRDVGAVIGILESLTGRRDIRRMLEEANVDDAVALISKLGLDKGKKKETTAGERARTVGD